MKFEKLFILAVFALVSTGTFAQAPEIDYNKPQKYVVGGVRVEGNRFVNSGQIIQISALDKGMEITVPGDDVSNIIKRLWAQRYFESVALEIDSLSAAGDSAYFVIKIAERPRMSGYSFTGIKKSEDKEIRDRLGLRRGNEFSDYVSKTCCDIIRRFYAEKGFLKCEVTPEVKKDTIIKNAIRVVFNVNKGEKVRIKTINFYGNEHVKEFKLAKAMKNTKSNKIYNFFKSKKFKEKEYITDRKDVLTPFNEAGYRDARLIKDSIYYITPKHLGIDLYFDEGDKYYFRNIDWTGNSVFSADQLNGILDLKKGDVYDIVSMQKRLFGGGKEGEQDVSKVYRDNGYLFFNLTPVEVTIENDSVDVELRVSEGKQATLNNIVINGNDLTNERVVRRQIFTRPGYLFSQSDFERSIREIASMGQFDAEAIMDPQKGYSIVPNGASSTVDIIYNVTEKPSSQLELSGGWGGNTFVATVGVSFNNFSTHRFFEKGAWRPVPLGDAQNLSFRFQTNGNYYTALSASFTEPWLFGKKPTSLNVSAYFTRQTDSNIWIGRLSNNRSMEVFGAAAQLGFRLKWPDNYFIMYHSLSWQSYNLHNWYSGYFIFDDGLSNNINYTLTLARNSTDQQIYPRVGTDFSLSVSLTPPYSLFRKYSFDAAGNKVPVANWRDVDYDYWTSQDRYRWVEYHKWKLNCATYVKLAGDLVLMARAQFGYLGYYNRNLGYSPFEGFLVGGDGMSGYNTYGSEVISLRGYTNYSLTPVQVTAYNSGGTAYAGNVYDKFTVELRYPVVMQPSSTIYALAFLEGGNCWSDIKYFNPFQMKRSAGVGARVFLPMLGLLGVDWGYGFDDPTNGKSQFHFVIGQQF
ncbi:MAG: outer membrane protein assembly factor BamA [Bacteroidales bacterium]|nr:outer membrane protein assembly factor BamA [Bacteroidales bacterium]